jgi:hypothetical protein
MIFMDLLDRLLSGKKVMISKRRNTAVIERAWVDVRINLLVTSMFVGWVAVITVLVFMCERAVYGGRYVTSHLAAILNNGVNWSSLLPPPLSVSHFRELPLFLPYSWIPILLWYRNILRTGHEPFWSYSHVSLG